jgi:hypothetical protein
VDKSVDERRKNRPRACRRRDWVNLRINWASNKPLFRMDKIVHKMQKTAKPLLQRNKSQPPYTL